jgi:hypothetical protein
MNDDFDFVYKYLGIYRFPAHVGEKLTGSVREEVARYFCDLSARDYIVIAKCALVAINKADGGKLSVQAMTNGLFLDWVVFVTKFGGDNIKHIEKVQENLAQTGKDNLPLLIYECSELFDCRAPLMQIMPVDRTSSQAEALSRSILSNICLPPSKLETRTRTSG